MPDINWNPTLYDQKHAFVFEYGKDLFSLLDPQPGERILDLGCGTGHLTSTLTRTGATVVGFDSSPQMIETARQTYPEIEFYVADARTFSFPEPFDAIFSNAALHWINEPERVVERMAAALKPGGRLVAEFGGKGNVASIMNALQQAIDDLKHEKMTAGWYFPSIGEYAALLEKHGFEVRYAYLFDRPTKLEEGEKGLRNWIHMFSESLLRALSQEDQQKLLASVEEKLRGQLFRDGDWFADYRRLRIVAYKL